ncbi:hypothetical protein AB0I28_32075 [Phytomonospora sp. NPDC050363]|uniref:hypothetical protein n=1 Tax=Phytomonospora sp. NPDC050363 TaxID=3155642 RepID=UPI0033E24C2E
MDADDVAPVTREYLRGLIVAVMEIRTPVAGRGRDTALRAVRDGARRIVATVREEGVELAPEIPSLVSLDSGALDRAKKGLAVGLMTPWMKDGTGDRGWCLGWIGAGAQHVEQAAGAALEHAEATGNLALPRESLLAHVRRLHQDGGWFKFYERFGRGRGPTPDSFSRRRHSTS